MALAPAVCAMVRVAVIDSGVNPNHPHVAPIAGGIAITEGGVSDDFTDTIGHGTAVAGAIREKAPQAEIYAVRIFHRALAAPGSVLLSALDWCLEQRMMFINLSLGTVNARYRDDFAARIARAKEIDATVIAAWQMGDAPAFPGSLPGVTAVIADAACPRESILLRDSHPLYAASPYPRPIPGVPVERNLQGISFAVANVTGFLAAQRQHAS